jgi:hypothetical protein
MTNNRENVFIQQLENGRQTIVAVGRFALSWELEAARKLPPAHYRQFHQNTMELLFAMRMELAEPPVLSDSEALDNRACAQEALMKICTMDGSSVLYENRNTRYTSFAGVLLPEAVDPALPMDQQDPCTSIPNPLNHPQPPASPEGVA